MSWAHLCQGIERRCGRWWPTLLSALQVSFWDGIALDLHTYIPSEHHTTSPSWLGCCNQGSQTLEMVMASFPLLCPKTCLHTDFLWGKWSLPVDLIHIDLFCLSPFNLVLPLPPLQCPPYHSPLATFPWVVVTASRCLFLLPCPLNLPVLTALLTAGWPREMASNEWIHILYPWWILLFDSLTHLHVQQMTLPPT